MSGKLLADAMKNGFQDKPLHITSTSQVDGCHCTMNFINARILSLNLFLVLYVIIYGIIFPAII